MEKNETSSSPTAPTPVPSEDKVVADTEIIENKIEVSSVLKAEEVVKSPSNNTKQIITTSVISRKTSEEYTSSQCPSSPPPTPIDPSPLQQAQQSPANASALAEALKLPAETITSSSDNESIIKSSDKIVDNIQQVPVLPVSPKKIDETPAVVEQDDVKIDNKIIKNNEMPIEVEENIVNVVKVKEIEATPPPPSSLDVKIEDVKIIEKCDEEISVPVEQTEEIPPPLPESPIPLPKASTDLLNFMSTQISDAPIVSDAIKNEIIENNKQDTIDVIPPPEKEEQVTTQELSNVSDDLEDLPPPPPPPAVEEKEEELSNHQADSILTPPRSPSPSDLPPPIVDTSFAMQNGDKNHKYDDDIVNEDKHVEAKLNGDIMKNDQCPLTILNNDQVTNK